ncbi:hypothetical protein [Paraburkholderia sp. C35]|uniref:hypothetical protein n=1 Tax=Paraburkholderia sp. C35 TaxID=2126993 RepID=UPI000D68A167|nr:hypothetical protein [Paraburkholderia sp. C35]
MAEVEHPWAYVSSTGPERVSAIQERIARIPFGGKSLGKTYWSPHKSGSRYPMEHVVLENKTTFFKYKNKADQSKGGPGESLSHRLFKDAISKLTGTRLKLIGMGEHQLEIQAGATEKEILFDDGRYSADAYLRFTSSTNLAMRWEGEAYIEVHHKHEVPVDKQKRLQGLGIPVIEIPLPDFFLYRQENNSTAEREEEHIDWVCKTLEKNGYLEGTVISDRRSKEFLETMITELEEKLSVAEANVMAVKNDRNDRLAQGERDAAQLKKDIADLRSGASRIVTKVATLQGELDIAGESLTAANEALTATRSALAKAKGAAKKSADEVVALREQLRTRLFIEGAVLGVLVTMVVALCIWG